jgi:dTDP-4-dehydrorhamnose reductase
MAGRKFGTVGSEELTWAMNAVLPSNVAHRYQNSTIAAFSTGCVYPFVALDSGGSLESDPPNPVGEYSMSCLGRERVFEYASKAFDTRVCLVRLNYAIDLRYGVLHDIAEAVYNERAVDISVPAFNAIWQGDATDQILRTLEIADSPAVPLNITGPETMSTAGTARIFAEKLGKSLEFSGSPGNTALLSNATLAISRLGYPRVSMGEMIDWTADWVARGGRSLDKPTHFESNDGTF